ncbi:MAG: MotA/TolQ/ExbB proton channel family protein [Alphaproteobacteria bacterium]
MPPVWTTKDIAHALDTSRHHLFLKWMIVTGVTAFALSAFWHLGLIQRIYAGDVSYLSIVISVLFLTFTMHCAIRTYGISRELYEAARVSEILRAGRSRTLGLAGDGVLVGNETVLPSCLLTDFIAELLRIRESGEERAGERTAWAQLLDSYGQQIRGGQDIGWFIADIMIKLGLLGTGIGFALLLNAVTNVAHLDVTNMKDAILAMSGGMGVKLYATISGLSGAMLLSLQYQFLDRGADDLVALITKVIEVQVAPLLKSRDGATTT